MNACEACFCRACQSKSSDDFEASFTEFDKEPGQEQQERLKKLSARSRLEQQNDGSIARGACSDSSGREDRFRAKRDQLSKNYAHTWRNVTLAGTATVDVLLHLSGKTGNTLTQQVLPFVTSEAATADLKDAYYDETNPEHWATSRSSVYVSQVLCVVATSVLDDLQSKKKAEQAKEEQLKKEVLNVNAAHEAKSQDFYASLQAERSELRQELAMLREERMLIQAERARLQSTWSSSSSEAVSSPNNQAQRPLVRNYPPAPPQQSNHGLKTQLGQLAETLSPITNTVAGFMADKKASEARLATMEESLQEDFGLKAPKETSQELPEDEAKETALQ